MCHEVVCMQGHLLVNLVKIISIYKIVVCNFALFIMPYSRSIILDTCFGKKCRSYENFYENHILVNLRP